MKTLETPGRHADGGGLYFAIGNGGRSFVFLYRDRSTGKLREMGLGSTNTISLQEARQKAAVARKLLLDGVDPLAHKRSKRAEARNEQTFGEFADSFVESLMPTFKNAKHRYQWKATLTNDAAPLRPMLLKDITTADVHRALAPLWNTKHETADRLRGRLERVFDAAKASGLRTGDNPAVWKNNLKPLLKRPALAIKHYAAIPYVEMPAFMNELRARDSVSALALEFTILTAARSGEVRGATWSEVNIDADAKLWIVPGERMKMGKEHKVPLSDRAVEILRSLKPGKPHEPIFQNAKSGGPLSNMAMLECLKDLRSGVTTHGFRSTFKDWASETAHFDNVVSEMALAHAIGDRVEAAYRRGDLFQKRAALMTEWAQFLSGASA